MTAQKSFSENKHTFMPFLRNCLRRSWPCAVWYTIALFLAMPVVMLMSVNTDYEVSVRLKRILSFISAYQYALITVCVLISVICGIMAMRYLMDRRSSYFFHSLPQTRLELYAANVIVQLVDFLFALFVNVLITFIIFCSTDIISAFGPLMLAVAKALMYFLLFYSITLIAGSVAGNIFSQLLMLVYSLAILPACYASLVSIICHSFYFTDTSYYLNNSRVYAALSPVARLMSLESIPLSAAECVTTVTVSLAIIVCAYYICRARAAEKSGTPIVFGALGEFIKISSLFPITFFFGFVFKAISFGGEGWRFFGFVVGALLGSMAFNLVLYLNPRRMLSGWRKLAVFFGCFILVWCLLGYGAISKAADKYVPDSDKVTEVQIGIGGDSCNFENEAIISAAVDAARKNIDLYPNVLYAPDTDEKYDCIYVSFVFYTSSGIGIAKEFPCYDMESITALRKMISASDEYVQQSIEPLRQLLDNTSEIYVEIFSVFGYDEKSYFGIDTSRIASAMIADIEAGTDRYKYPSIGSFNYMVYINEYYRYRTFEIRLCDVNTISLIASVNGMTYSEYMDYIRGLISDRVISVTVNRLSDGEEVKFTDSDEILEIAYSLSNLGVSYSQNDLLLMTDRDYEVIVRYTDNTDLVADPDEEYYYSFFSEFLLGQVPDFVKDSFKK